jgi:nucleoside-diphosphate-sugar epimerase
MSEKAYAIVRVGTVLGEGMPAKTAANIFIDKGLQGQSITPYSQDMHRPMLYVDIEDVCEMCRLYASRILNGNASDLPRVVNLFWPKPITILELAEGIRDTIVRLSHGATKPRVEVIDRGVSSAFTNKSGERIVVNIERALALVGSGKLTDPWKSIERIVQSRMKEAAKGS